jgi:hypothetical protein
VAIAGNDTVICENSPFLAQGTASHHTGVLWSSSGTGNFIPNPPSQLSSIYLRSNQDIANGGVTLTLTAFGYEPGSETSDDVYVAINQQAEAYAGNDTVICYYHVLATDALANYYSSLEWTTAGDGTFDDPTILSAIYTPGPDDVEAGFVKLTLTAQSIDPCDEPKSDPMNLIIDACTGIETLEEDVFDLTIFPNPGSGLFDIQVQGADGQLFDIQILDASGAVLFTQRNIIKNGNILKKINLMNFPEGIYFVNVQRGNTVKTAKFILQSAE